MVITLVVVLVTFFFCLVARSQHMIANSNRVGANACVGLEESACAYTCDTGFSDTGSGSSVCQTSGVFSRSSCLPDSCTP